MTGTITTHEQDGVLEIRLDRPDKKNAITGAMYDAMREALADGCGRPSVRVFLISAAGETFSAGNDIGDFLHYRGAFEDSPAARFILALAACAKPVVAAVQGKAVGVGTTMLLHCDLVYASPDASFSLPFVAMGLVPEAGSSLILPRLLGAQGAARLLLLGESMTAQQALAAGLVCELVPAATLRDHARSKAAMLAAKPPNALAQARALMRGDATELTVRIDQEFRAFADAVRGPEAQEALTAFMEKRAPDFSRQR